MVLGSCGKGHRVFWCTEASEITYASFFGIEGLELWESGTYYRVRGTRDSGVTSDVMTECVSLQQWAMTGCDVISMFIWVVFSLLNDAASRLDCHVERFSDG